jgi:hypothetical protein
MGLPPEERNASPAPSRPNLRRLIPGGCVLVLVGIPLYVWGALSVPETFDLPPVGSAGLLLALAGFILFVYGLAVWSLRRPRRR